MTAQKLIEAICYARWSHEKAGFSWQSTINENTDEKIRKIVKNIQSLWEKIEYDTPVWLQGEWCEEIDVIYFGLVKKDRDENGRPAHIKEIWIIERNLWEKFGANTPLYWKSHYWFTDFGNIQQSQLFLQNAQKTKKFLQISPPTWLSYFISQFISFESSSKTLIIPEDDIEIIFHTLSLLPLSIKQKLRHFTIGWHPSLLHITNQFDVVFCSQENLEKTFQLLHPYGAQLIDKKNIQDFQVTAIINSMFPHIQKTLKNSEDPFQINIATKSHSEMETNLPSKKKSLTSLAFIFLLVFFLGVIFLGLSLKKQSELRIEIAMLSGEIQNLEKLKSENKKLSEENQTLEENLEKLKSKNKLAEELKNFFQTLFQKLKNFFQILFQKFFSGERK